MYSAKVIDHFFEHPNVGEIKCQWSRNCWKFGGV